jgi:hypothetical protein
MFRLAFLCRYAHVTLPIDHLTIEDWGSSHHHSIETSASMKQLCTLWSLSDSLWLAVYSQAPRDGLLAHYSQA